MPPSIREQNGRVHRARLRRRLSGLYDLAAFIALSTITILALAGLYSVAGWAV